MKTTVKCAALQMNSGDCLEQNLAITAQHINQAADSGVDLLVLPENFCLMPKTEIERISIAEHEGDGKIQEFLSNQARDNAITIVGGTIPLHAKDQKRVRAACCVFNAEGDQIARYDKIHLFDVELDAGEHYFESEAIEPGETPVVVDTPLGRIGLSVCYDIRFPEYYRILNERSAQIVVIPSAFTQTTGKAHWHTLVRARAIENQFFVVAPGQTGHHPSGRETHGNSLIVDPWGKVLAKREHDSGLAIADCNLTDISKIRKSIPVASHRRF